jgi:hypothetical protein
MVIIGKREANEVHSPFTSEIYAKRERERRRLGKKEL